MIFLTGGDQLRLTTILGGSKVLQAIQNRLEAGAHIAGTNAGAAVFSDTMSYEGKGEEGLFKGSVLTTSGFGFVEKIIFDTHISALQNLLEETSQKISISSTLEICETSD